MSVFKKPIPREAPSARGAPVRPDPSPLEVGLKGVMDSIGSAMEAAQSAWSPKERAPERGGPPADTQVEESPEQHTGESLRDPARAQGSALNAADRRAIGLVFGLLAGGLALFLLLVINLALSHSVGSGSSERTGVSERDRAEAYRQDVEECSRRYQNLSSTAFAFAVTKCMETRGHDQSFVRNPIR